MYSTFATVLSILSKSSSYTVSVPVAPILFNFNSAYVSGTTVSNAGSGGTNTISLRNPTTTSNLMLSTASKEGSHCIIGWVNPNLYHTEAISFGCYIYNCTISYWVTGADTNFSVPFSIGVSTTSNLYHQSDGATRMNIWYGGSKIIVGNAANSTAVSGTAFAHCVITITSDGLVSAYVNNVLVGSTTVTPITTLQTNINHFRLLDGTRNFGGKLDCFRIYDYVLSTNEINAIYTAGV